MPAVELPNRQEVQKRHKKANQPANAMGCSTMFMLSAEILRTSRVSAEKRKESPKRIPPSSSGFKGRTSERERPSIIAGTASTAPAQGPAAPTSNKARRFNGGDFMRM